MCGRFSVTGRIAPSVSNLFNTHFSVMTNTNFSPSQIASTITLGQSGYEQDNAAWGIQPSWSKRLIINAQAETVATKPTFKNAFQHQRCLIPCNGWFEWRNEAGQKKKYFFEHADKAPMYMAGILFKHEMTELVTLTTSPNAKCSPYHKRMPVLPHHTEYWFRASHEELLPLLAPLNDEMVNIYNTE